MPIKSKKQTQKDMKQTREKAMRIAKKTIPTPITEKVEKAAQVQKTPAKKEPRKVGRPPKITEVILRKLEEGFLYGLTDEQACLYADVPTSTFYDFLKKNPEFAERKEILKNQPKIDAKITIAKALRPHDDPRLALEVAKNTMRDEYNTRQELTGKDGEDLKAPEITIKIVE